MISQWSARRRAIMFVLFFLFILLVVAWPVYYFYFRPAPSCHNQKMDGDETGVDCGGTCDLLCKPETLPLITQGDARLLQVGDNAYEVVIVVQNPNTFGRVLRAPYTFTIYNATAAVPPKVINGNTFIGRGSTFALFAGPFSLDGAGPSRVVFEWGDLKWEKNDDQPQIIAVSNISLITASTSLPRLEATLTNKSLKGAKHIEVVALLSDGSGNIVAAGKTFVDAISPGEAAPIAFSWPAAFSTVPVSIRIIPHILPDNSYIK